MDAGKEKFGGIELKPTRRGRAAGTAAVRFGRAPVRRGKPARHRRDAPCGGGERNMSASLATVYSTLNQFADAGLLHEVAIEGSKTYFDMAISGYQHFYVEHDGRLMTWGRMRKWTWPCGGFPKA
jgi:Fur family transcriptional regulator, iron response regulator